MERVLHVCGCPKVAYTTVINVNSNYYDSDINYQKINKMENIKFLSQVLTTAHEYWIVAKKNEYNTIARSGRDKDSIIFLAIPKDVKRNIPYDAIRLVDLEKLQKSAMDCNVFINESYAPFQIGQHFYDIFEGYPIERNQKEFLIKALELKSDKIWDYKVLIDEICNEKQEKI